MGGIHRNGIEFVDAGDFYVNFFRNAGSVDMVVDGSVTPVEFSIDVPVGWDILAYRASIHILDNTSCNVNQFGSIPALTNGVRFVLKDPDGNETADFLGGETIKTNGDFAAFAGINVQMIGTGSRGVVADWIIDQSSGGRPMRLLENYSLAIIIQDNLTGLTHMEATLQGVKIQTGANTHY